MDSRQTCLEKEEFERFIQQISAWNDEGGPKLILSQINNNEIYLSNELAEHLKQVILDSNHKIPFELLDESITAFVDQYRPIAEILALLAMKQLSEDESTSKTQAAAAIWLSCVCFPKSLKELYRFFDPLIQKFDITLKEIFPHEIYQQYCEEVRRQKSVFQNAAALLQSIGRTFGPIPVLTEEEQFAKVISIGLDKLNASARRSDASPSGVNTNSAENIVQQNDAFRAQIMNLPPAAAPAPSRERDRARMVGGRGAGETSAEKRRKINEQEHIYISPSKKGSASDDVV